MSGPTVDNVAHEVILYLVQSTTYQVPVCTRYDAPADTSSIVKCGNGAAVLYVRVAWCCWDVRVQRVEAQPYSIPGVILVRTDINYQVHQVDW